MTFSNEGSLFDFDRKSQAGRTSKEGSLFDLERKQQVPNKEGEPYIEP